MYEINTILCAIAMTDSDDRIMSRALHEAQVHGARMHILHVLPDVSEIMVHPVVIMMGKEKYEQLVSEHMTEIQSTIRARIDSLKEEILTGDLSGAGTLMADVHVVQGDAVIEILEATRNLKADMLVIGTHAKGLTEHTFMGDVAHKVLKRTRVPVLVVPGVKETG